MSQPAEPERYCCCAGTVLPFATVVLADPRLSVVAERQATEHADQPAPQQGGAGAVARRGGVRAVTRGGTQLTTAGGRAQCHHLGDELDVAVTWKCCRSATPARRPAPIGEHTAI